MTKMGGAAGAGSVARSDSASGLSMGIEFHNLYKFECFDAEGNLKWSEEVHNQVFTAGKNDLLTNYFKGSAYTAAWYAGLVSGSSVTFADGDTAASHSGWTEFTNYSQTARPTWSGGTASNGSIDNSASQAVFTINGAGGTVGGAFLISNSTKAGTTGVLYGGAALSAARTLASGDTLNITVTLTV